MRIKKVKCVKIVKCAIVSYVLLTAWFSFVNPWGCSRYYESPLLRTKYSARRLYVELDELNTNGQDPWPPAPGLLNGDALPQQGAVCSSSVEYFDWLFRMDDYGREDWNPRIRGLPISIVTFDDAATGFTSDNVKWTVAEGVNKETPDSAIILASANLDCSCLLSSYDGSADFLIVTNDGKPAIVVRKDGSVDLIEKQYLNARYLYRRHAFTGGPKSYLTPKGRVWTKR